MNIDSIIFVLYLVGLIVLGLLTARLITTTEEYYVAGRRLRLWLAFFHDSCHVDWRRHHDRGCG